MKRGLNEGKVWPGHAENSKKEEKIELSPPPPQKMIQKHLIGKAFEHKIGYKTHKRSVVLVVIMQWPLRG